MNADVLCLNETFWYECKNLLRLLPHMYFVNGNEKLQLEFVVFLVRYTFSKVFKKKGMMLRK